MKTERTAVMIVKPAIIVVVRAPVDSIRSIIVWTVDHSHPNSSLEASCPGKTQDRKENRQHKKSNQ